MNNKTLYRTSEYISSLENIGISVTLNENPNPSTIQRIKELINKKENLFTFQKSLFN
jgi:hypothetical protein